MVLKEEQCIYHERHLSLPYLKVNAAKSPVERRLHQGALSNIAFASASSGRLSPALDPLNVWGCGKAEMCTSALGFGHQS